MRRWPLTRGDGPIEVAARPLHSRSNSETREALFGVLRWRMFPVRLCLIEQRAGALHVTAQQFDVGEFLTRIGERGWIGVRSSL